MGPWQHALSQSQRSAGPGRYLSRWLPSSQATAKAWANVRHYKASEACEQCQTKTVTNSGDPIHNFNAVHHCVRTLNSSSVPH